VRRAGWWALVLGLALAPALAPSAARAATSVAFDRLDGGPRDIALGAHVVALLDDDYALGMSPGRLAYAGGSASAQYDRIDQDVDLWRGRVGGVKPVGREITEPLQPGRLWRAVAGASLDVTQLSLIEGSSYREMTATGGAGMALLDFLAVGGSVHYDRASSDVTDLHATGFGVDLGVAGALADHWDAAMAIKNAFGRVKFEGDRSEDRAAEFTVGIAAAHHRRWQAEADYVLQDNRSAASSVGLELHLVPGTLDLRGGLASERLPFRRTVASAGLGFELRRLKLDYAFRSDPDGLSDAQHQVAIGTRF